MKTEKCIILCCFISIGIYVIVVSAGYPRIPNTMSSGFFPVVVSVFLVCLSLLELVLTMITKGGTSTVDKTTGGSTQGSNLPKIMLVSAMLAAMILITRYVHPAAGIFVFLFVYLVLIAKTRIKLSVPVSAAGTVVMYIIIKLLQIPL